MQQTDKLYQINDAKRHQLLINAVVDYAIYMISLDGLVLSWNSGGQRLKGFESQEIIGQPFARFFTPEDQAEGLPQRALMIAAKEGKFETEGWRVRKDGSRFWALAVIDAMKDEDGELIGFVKITRDLTERRLALQRLLDSEQRYRRMIEAVVDYAIFQLDVDGYVTPGIRGPSVSRVTPRKRLSASTSAGSIRAKIVRLAFRPRRC